MHYLTYLNAGCIDICRNMLISAKNVGIDNFHIACLDQISFESMKEYSDNVFLYLDQELTDYQNWTFDQNSGFRKIIKHKWSIIRKVYQEHKNLCFVDSDIVFLQNPTEVLFGKDKILFQSDSYPKGSYICSGFMVFNDTPECAALIDECSANFEEDDQLVVNRLVSEKYWNYHELLDETLFPNGHVYFDQGRQSKAMIVHNNWIVGIENKINRFKQAGLWYVI